MVFTTLAPFVVGYFLTLVTSISNSFENTGTVHGKIQQIGQVLHCTEKENFMEGVDEPCLSIGYGIIGPSSNLFDEAYSRYHDIMKILARNNDFDYGKDVRPLQLDSHNKVEQFLDQNQNQTQYVVMFCHE